MTFGMEIMIMVALAVFVVTGLVSIGLTLWYLKAFGPVFKKMLKQYTMMIDELEEDEEEVEIKRIK